MRLALGVLAALLLWPQAGRAWGPEGHRQAAHITAQRLCPAATREAESILGGQTLAEAALWPDAIRGEPRWAHTSNWHYLNLAADEAFDAIAEGAPGRGRLLAAIREMLALMQDRQAPRARRAEALAFLLHLVADLHQPLHIGKPGDRGGNEVTVSFQGRETNLHRLWDGGLLHSSALRPDDYRRSLAPLVELGAGAWESGTLEDWADESRRLRPWVYDFDARRRVPVISKRYAETGRQLSALRLAQAGVRGAWLLNQSWCP